MGRGSHFMGGVRPRQPPQLTKGPQWPCSLPRIGCRSCLSWGLASSHLLAVTAVHHSAPPLATDWKGVEPHDRQCLQPISIEGQQPSCQQPPSLPLSWQAVTALNMFFLTPPPHRFCRFHGHCPDFTVNAGFHRIRKIVIAITSEKSIQSTLAIRNVILQSAILPISALAFRILITTNSTKKIHIPINNSLSN